MAKTKILFLTRNLNYAWGCLAADLPVQALVDQQEVLLKHAPWASQVRSVDWHQVWDAAELSKFIHHHSGAGLIMGFKPQARWHKLAQQLGWQVAANPLALHRQLEDKLAFSDLLQQWQLPRLPVFVGPSQAFDTAHYASQWQTDAWVVQLRRGWGGQGSWLVWGDAQWQDWQIKHGNQVVRISPFMPQSLTLTVNAVNWQAETFFSPPAVQITNLDQSLADSPLATIGRSWPATLPQVQFEKLYQLLDLLASRLRQLGYLGYWGADLLWQPQGKFHFLELNARLTASESFYSRLEQQAGLSPLIKAHVLAFVDQSQPEPFRGRHLVSLQGSQVLLKKKVGHKPLPTGFFILTSGQLRPMAKEWLAIDATWHVSIRQPVTASGEWLRLETAQQLVDNQAKLLPEVKHLLDQWINK